jgi:hypothetical protein
VIVDRDPGDEHPAELDRIDLMRLASKIAAVAWGMARPESPLADFQPARRVTREATTFSGVYYRVWVGDRPWAVTPHTDDAREQLEQAWRYGAAPGAT